MFDSHLHYAALAREQWLQWREAGLSGAIGCTARPAQWAMPPGYPAGWDGLQIAWGVHPWFAREADGEALARLECALRSDGALQVGEIGLDYVRIHSLAPERQIQCAAFESQLSLADRHGRIAVLHVRKAWDDFFAIMERHRGCHAIIHGFCGSVELARRILKDLPNCDISFGASLCNPNAVRLRAAAAIVPASRYRTDSDWPFRGGFTPVDCARLSPERLVGDGEADPRRSP